MTVFQEPHLTVFKDSLSEGLLPDDLGGKSWRVFTNGLDGIDPDSFEPADTDKGKIRRSEIFALAADDRIGTPTVCAAVFAWGGMNMTYHKELFNQADAKWLVVVDQLRHAECSRQQAYDHLRGIRANGALKGLGPAFYTKLIYFLTRRDREDVHQGYIMDQWAACSINLLVGKPIVHLNCSMTAAKDRKPTTYDFIVSDLNSGLQYEAFCVAMDALVALNPDYSPDMIDRALLGNGKNKKEISTWRAHVIRHRVL
jgi:hypothetical protein